MLESYFFIPADKPKYLRKMAEIDSDYLVLDLEDAVAPKNKQLAIELIAELLPSPNTFARIPFFDGVYSNPQIIQLIEQFEGRIVIPKSQTVYDIERVIKLCPLLPKMIVLVENPQCLLELPDILKKYSKQIYAIGFGSHDFCSYTCIKHEHKYLAAYKQQLILYSKAYNVKYLDGVDLDLSDLSIFREECKFAYEAGANGKFMIHPIQLNEIRKVEYLSSEEIIRLNEVYERVKQIPMEELDVLTINGRVYEKPHVVRIKMMMEKRNN